MSASGVSRDGITNPRPGREARVGGQQGRRRGSRGEQSMVPDAEFRSYYGKPILNSPVWQAPDIPGYLFLGGLAGASSLLAAGAQATGRHGLERATKVGAAGAISVGLLGLVHDLGRPARFINMLRVLKPTSPMSVGSWLLAGYAPAAGLAAGSAVTGWLTPIGTAATAGSAVLGPLVAAYTAALVTDTAVPAWHDGYREMPFIFVGSAASAAGGLGMFAAPVGQAGPARTVGAAGGVLEVLGVRWMHRRMGAQAEPYRRGGAGLAMRAAEALTISGALGAALLGRRSRLAANACGLALLAGSALTRFGIFEAGLASAKDPVQTVRPQRERLRLRDGQTAGSG